MGWRLICRRSLRVTRSIGWRNCWRSAASKNFMVEIGGEVRAAGQREDGKPWRVAIERPIAGKREMAVGGAARECGDRDGRRDYQQVF